MILRILLIACAVLHQPTFGLDYADFYDKYFEKCFKKDENGPFRLNGQDTPLSSTLDNFIAKAEQLEAANRNLDLKDELQYFISEYLFENIQITNGGINKVSFGRIQLEKIISLWATEGYMPELNDPFTDEEKCNLYHLISHSILAEDTSLMRSYTNESIFVRNDLKSENYYPQEIGVVSLGGSDDAISLGKVLVGLYVGLKNQRKSQLRSFEPWVKNISQELLDKNVDALYATTMADVLMASSFEGFERRGIAGNGEWLSVPIPGNGVSGAGERMEGFCPMVYKHPEVDSIKQLPAYSYASVRGAADGLILGLTVPKIYNTDTRLSHILRMYYSPRGIIFDDFIEDIAANTQQVSVCNRESVINSMESNIAEQMLLYGYLVSEINPDIITSYDKSRSMYGEIKGSVYYNKDESGYCTQATSLEKPEDLRAETFLDIIVVMDTSNTQKNFVDQQLIIGYLAKQLDLRYHGSRMTVLLDQRINLNSPSGSSRIELKPVVNDSYSTSCAACVVAQLNYEQSTIPREDVITAVDQLIQERKENETSFTGANGKVVIYFNYENGDGRPTNSRVQDKVEKALRDFNLRHQDVLLYSVGLDVEILKKYAKDDPTLVFLGSEGKPEQVADKIFKKLTYAPTLLQYTDCKEARNEKSATYETFVSPNKIQHYTIPAKYFYKSFNIKVLFESADGQIRVCYNRATMRPENEVKYCKETSQGTAAEFRVSNPCKSFTRESCSPMYFAVIGKDPMADNNGNQAQRQRSPCKANDRMCSTLDQIKFKVSHEGIRCSGCLGLAAPPAVILFTVLLSFFLHRKF